MNKGILQNGDPKASQLANSYSSKLRSKVEFSDETFRCGFRWKCGEEGSKRTDAVDSETAKPQDPAKSEMDDFHSDGFISTRVESRQRLDNSKRETEIRRGMDLATTLERIEKNFVITDPRLPDNPTIFASDHFLELTEYTREELLGGNCLTILQGPDTDMEIAGKISDAIKAQQTITVQLLSYTKTGRPFWSLFHLEAMKNNKGELSQYFIGVQLDGESINETLSRRRMSETTEEKGKKMAQSTAKDVNEALLRELPDHANLISPEEDLWATLNSRHVLPKPHRRNSSTWQAVQRILSSGEALGLKHFRSMKSLGSGKTGRVHLVQLRCTTEFFAMKTMEKPVYRGYHRKGHRARVEREILEQLDHPFLPTFYGSFQTPSHVCLIMDFCPGGDLSRLLARQPRKRVHEATARFYAAEIVLALEYLHCLGVLYRDLKPENVLIQRDGHVQLTDFDLSLLTASTPQLLVKPSAVISGGRRRKRIASKGSELRPILLTEPSARSNSFVGTEEYVAPETILGLGHQSSVDWWALGILLYEMLVGRTPFRGRNRQRTFANVLHKEIGFPNSISPLSMEAKELIQGLLHRDPNKRLGSDNGANDLKSHQFFCGVNWPLIRCVAPPVLETPVLFTHTVPSSMDLRSQAEIQGTRSFDEAF